MGRDVVKTEDMVFVLDPAQPFAGPVRDGGTIVATAAPGCWGPMITPDYPSGHEVSRPVTVQGAEIGDAVAIRIRKITVLSLATTSGTDEPIEGSFVGSPSLAAKCPGCGTVNPSTYLDGVGEDSVKCRKCGATVKPVRLESTYTIMMDDDRTVAVTVPPGIAADIARRPAEFSALPACSRQYSANLCARGEIPGLFAPLRPMIGNLGSCPSIELPSSQNAGDYACALAGAPHRFAITPEQAQSALTDGHMDVNDVVEGSVVIVPVKVPGAGIYMGDVHAVMGDGEIAGHTTDVTAEAVLEVKVLKGLRLDGPILLPIPEDLPVIVKPRPADLTRRALALAERCGLALEESLPIQVIGTGPDLNAATTNGLDRMARLTGIPLPEVRNRCTITGQVDIGRLPGVVQISMLVPCEALKRIGLFDVVSEQYNKGGHAGGS